MPRVLIIEDDDPLRQMIAEILREAGYAVVEAANPQDACSVAHQPIDLILLDLLMPHISGIDAAWYLRSQPEWKKVPIIVVSAHHHLHELGLPVNACLSKPFNIDELEMTVQRFVPLPL